MKWKDMPQSDNVEVDCLNETTKLNSPEAGAVMKCWDEVNALRKATIGRAKNPDVIAQREADFEQAMRMFLSTHAKPNILKLGDTTGAEQHVADPQGAFKEFKTQLPDLLRVIQTGRGSVDHIRLGFPDGRSPHKQPRDTPIPRDTPLPKQEPRDTPIPRDTPLPNEQHKATPKPKPDQEQNVPIPKPRPKGI
jgi:hypothetical protein